MSLFHEIYTDLIQTLQVMIQSSDAKRRNIFSCDVRSINMLWLKQSADRGQKSIRCFKLFKLLLSYRKYTIRM